MNRTLLLCLVPLLAWTVPAQEAAPTEPAEVTLPVYEIAETREKPRPEPWLYGSVTGFEILSCGSESQTSKLVTELQRFRIALGSVWPEAIRQAGPPVTLILCGRGDTFDPFAPYNPEERTSNSAAASRFLSDRDGAFLVVDLTRRTVQLVDDEDFRTEGSEGDTGQVLIDHYEELIHAYVRHLVRRPNPPPPPWLAEGLAQIIAGIKYDRFSIEFGQLDGATGDIARGATAMSSSTGRDTMGEGTSVNETVNYGAARDEDFSSRSGGLIVMPLEQFFAVTEDSAAATLTIGTNWADQAHAFVHLCIYGENHRFQKGFIEFVSRLQTEPVSEELFQSCFGMNYAKFGGFLRRYTSSAWYKSERFDLAKGKPPDPEPVVLREAVPAEIARIRGDALLLARGEDTAFLAMVDAYRDGEHDAQLLASLGLVELRRGNLENARQFLEAATRDQVVRPRAYTELARLRLEAFGVRDDAAGAKLTKAQLAQVLRPLFAARSQRPAIPDTYALIARAWEASATPPTKDHLAVLLEGAARFPTDSDTLMRAARLHQAAGLLREAGGLASLGAIWAADPSWIAQFKVFERTLPPEARVDLTKREPAAPPGKKTPGGG